MSDFSDAERAAVYRVIAERRDVRSFFVDKPLPDDVLGRVLAAAHQGPSVGLMQPTRFLLVRDRQWREQVQALFREANEGARQAYGMGSEHAAAYQALKLEGIVESALNVCVLCEQKSAQGSGLGRQTMPEMARYSTVCAVQNLWLAARAEGVGVGWVSILDPARLAAMLGVPAHLTIVAYLCVGYVSAFGEAPELETLGWEQRRGLAEMVANERCPEHW